MSDYPDKIAEDARLFILAELAQQRDRTLNVVSLTRVLDALGIRRSREWVDTQLLKLEELGAVSLIETAIPGIGSVKAATLTTAGKAHVDKRATISGVTHPADIG